jgi:SNF2 family DNA or RNA helicase
VQQWRKIIQKFNTDQRIKCLLLLSRMPHVGLELPNADAVIYYDTDVRSSAHDHAREFCHRLALVRDLEIFRLVLIIDCTFGLIKLPAVATYIE